MKKLIVLLAAPFLLVAFLAAAPAQADDTDTDYKNHGQCVRDSEKPDGKGGRSEVAKSDACRDAKPDHPDHEPEDTIDCTDAVEGGDGNVVVDEDADEVTISGGGTGTPGSSLECDVTFTVDADDTVVFTYELGAGTAPCGGGVPRIYVTVDGTNYNTFDWDHDCSEAEGNTITFDIPDDGTLTHIGLVYDRGDFGSITYSDVSVAGMDVDF